MKIISMFVIAIFVSGYCFAKNSTNSKNRLRVIDSIILHSIAGPSCSKGRVKFSNAKDDLRFWKGFFEHHKVVGIHYLIDRQGVIANSIDEAMVANHAIGWNTRSIGIELLNKGDSVEPFPNIQMRSLKMLVKKLQLKYPQIKKERVLRHSDVDHRFFECGSRKVKKKQDPGKQFHYKQFLNSLD